ncbi:MAG: helix-turn-helix transcriptional regulator [Clostridiales bacterium]|nr:helix-turn-helix transcriptional regulator [Clostridiales bacterium]
MTIGERIKNLRKDSLKLTMEDFGSRLGVGKTAISRIESGDRAVTEQMQIAICREFHVRPEWLRDGEEPIFAERDQNDLINEYIDDILSDDERADPIAVKLIETLAKMDRTSLKAVYDFCEAWVRSVEEKEAAEQQKESRPLGTPEGIAEAEAAYEKRFGIPSKAESSMSDTGAAGRKDA